MQLLELYILVDYIPWIVSLIRCKVVRMKNTHQTIAKQIASNVKSLRKTRGMTQEEFADFAEIDRTYASQIERAIANPSLSVLCKIADVFEVDLKDLLT